MLRKRDKNGTVTKEQRVDYCITALKAFYVGVLAGLALSGMLYCATQAKNSDMQEQERVRIIFAASLYILIAHVVFHLGEFLVTMLTGRDEYANHGSFLLYHSSIYTTATIMAWIEFFVETLLISENRKMFSNTPISDNRKVTYLHSIMHFTFRLNVKSSLVFALLALLFYAIRLIAMVQCGKNFSLRVERECRREHILIKSGLYRYLRHPAYFGWFWKVVFSQLILANPISLVIHTVLTWLFFSYIIEIEESAMSRNDYFGYKYREYQEHTYIGIPFINGKTS